MHRPKDGQQCEDAADVGSDLSVMSSAVFTGPEESDPAAQYAPADVRQIRLHLKFQE
jgi:hypothetical protein